jgi:hypothetical protein
MTKLRTSRIATIIMVIFQFELGMAVILSPNPREVPLAAGTPAPLLMAIGL